MIAGGIGSSNRKFEGRLDLLFGALSDPTRRALLSRLTQGPGTISELAAPFAMSLPALSRHIRVLEKAHLVRRQVEGRVHRCCLLPEALRDVEIWLDDYRIFWGSTLDSLARHVERKRSRGRQSARGARRQGPVT